MRGVHLALARGAIAAGLDERALTEGRAAMTIEPGSEIAVLTTARILVNKAPGDAARLLQDFIDRNPKTIEVARRARAHLCRPWRIRRGPRGLERSAGGRSEQSGSHAVARPGVGASARLRQCHARTQGLPRRRRQGRCAKRRRRQRLVRARCGGRRPASIRRSQCLSRPGCRRATATSTPRPASRAIWRVRTDRRCAHLAACAAAAR